MRVPMTLILIKEVTIKGSFRYGVNYPHTYQRYVDLHPVPQPGDYPFAISLVAHGRVDLKSLVTHRLVR